MSQPSRAFVFAFLSAGLGGCAGTDDLHSPIKDDTGAADDGAGGEGGTDGTDGASGTDADGDGFTVEEGDCDDTDFRINPAWPEEPDDALDNDCDGRVDEQWQGFAVATQRGGDARSSVLLLDTVGREEDELSLPEGVVPWGITEDPTGGWLFVGYPYFAEVAAGYSPVAAGLVPALDASVPWYQPSTLYHLDSSGTATALLDLGDPEYDACFALPESAWGDCFGELDPRTYFYGPYLRAVLPLPEGRVALLVPGALRIREADGTTAEVASWTWNLSEEGAVYEMYGNALAWDPQTQTLGIADLLGGFATWSAADGFVLHSQVSLGEDFDPNAIFLNAGLAFDPGVGFTAISTVYGTGAQAIRTFDLASGRWEDRVDWTDSLITPLGLDAETDSGDLYVSSKAGEYRSVFRVRGADGSIDDFLNLIESDVNFWGIATRY